MIQWVAYIEASMPCTRPTISYESPMIESTAQNGRTHGRSWVFDLVLEVLPNRRLHLVDQAVQCVPDGSEKTVNSQGKAVKRK